MEGHSTENNNRDSQNVPNDGSRNCLDPETVITISGDETADSNAEPRNRKDKASPVEEKTSSCVIEIKVDEFVLANQRICRICQLSAKEIGTTELMELGCGCKGELGSAHFLCAEAWFRVRGNRLCEICGETAKNVMGCDANGFLEEWNEGYSGNGGTASTSESNRRCRRGQPLCNFLMACLVVAFILPWFFRVNML